MTALNLGAASRATPFRCPYCAEALPAGSRKCLLCRRAVTADARADDVYEVTAFKPETSAHWHSAAFDTLETVVRCLRCRESVGSPRALAPGRTQAAFTSTLPRTGRIQACPECERILSAELSGF